ncbi:hypothetical protein [Sanyastnella coralliicola]|uniref:hypothetical protein n=1 Tax=Sanyastnella coralliicola TaxID=3069118 RepID=UPI0027B8A319|nr:hypothetical protein [Longitalea sp. SCSIO 12813]
MLRSLIGVLFMLPLAAQAQCLSGTLSVSGAGCGCLGGCNLLAYGGPNCGAGTSGNCDGGQQSMSVWIDTQDASCEIQVEARMSNRPGCTASGADSGDQLRVRNSAGSSPWMTGASNSTLYDSHTQTGGYIVVEGSANRADEIITYDVNYVDGTCPFCILLPVTYTSFDAYLDGTDLLLSWETASEQDNQGFYVEIGRTLADFEPVQFVPGNGNSSVSNTYHHMLDLHAGGSYYVRLRQQDFNGMFTYSPVIEVSLPYYETFDVSFVSERAQIRYQGKSIQACQFSVYSFSGQLIQQQTQTMDEGEVFEMDLNIHRGILHVMDADGNIFRQKFVF